MSRNKGRNRYGLLLVRPPEFFRPQRPWDVPDEFTEGRLFMKNVGIEAAKATAVTFNRLQLEQADPPRAWAIVWRSPKTGRGPCDRELVRELLDAVGPERAGRYVRRHGGWVDPADEDQAGDALTVVDDPTPIPDPDTGLRVCVEIPGAPAPMRFAGMLSTTLPTFPFGKSRLVAADDLAHALGCQPGDALSAADLPAGSRLIYEGGRTRTARELIRKATQARFQVAHERGGAL